MTTHKDLQLAVTSLQHYQMGSFVAWARVMATMAVSIALAFSSGPTSALAETLLAVTTPHRPGTAQVNLRVTRVGDQTILWLNRRATELPSAGATRAALRLARHAPLAAIDTFLGDGAPDTAALVWFGGAQPRVLWVDHTDWRGPASEARRGALSFDETSGHVVVAEQRRAGLCGHPAALLSPRSLVGGGLRPVPLEHALDEAAALVAAPARTLPGEPLVRVAEIQASSRALETDPTSALTDGDRATGWLFSGAAGPSSEFITARFDTGGAPVTEVQVSFWTRPRTQAPQAFWLVGGDGTAFRVDVPTSLSSAAAIAVTLPEPAPWSCLSLVLEGPREGAVGISELTPLTSLYVPAGVTSLWTRLTEGGRAADSALRILDTLETAALTPRLASLSSLSEAAQVRVIRLLSHRAGEPPVHVALGQFLRRIGAVGARGSAATVTRPEADAITLWVPHAEEAALREFLVRARPAAQVEAGRHGLARDPALVVATLLESASLSRSITPKMRAFLRTAFRAHPVVGATAVARFLARHPEPAACARLVSVLGALPEAVGALAALLLAATRDEFRPSLAFDDAFRLARGARSAPEDPALARWLLAVARNSSHWMLRAEALIALAKQGVGAETLLSFLSDPSPRVRSAALRALGESDGLTSAHLPVVARRLADRWPSVRVAALERLRGAQQAVALIVPRVADRAPAVRVAAIEALMATDPAPGAGEAVRARLSAQDELPMVLEAALAFALAHGNRDWIPSLKDLRRRLGEGLEAGGLQAAVADAISRLTHEGTRSGGP